MRRRIVAVITSIVVLEFTSASEAQSMLPDECNSAKGEEIVVCGSRPTESPYRLPKLDQRYERKPLRAETDVIPGVHTRAHAEADRLPGGSLSKKLLVTFSTGF